MSRSLCGVEVSRRGACSGRSTRIGMRIERDGDGGAARAARIVERAVDDRAMAEMHAIEDADGEEERAGKPGEVGDRARARK